jgi:hypothetical protein
MRAKLFGKSQTKKLRFKEPSTEPIAGDDIILRMQGTRFLFRIGTLTPARFICITDHSCV